MPYTDLEKLHEAVSLANLKKVEALLKKGISPTKKDKDGCDALWAATSSFVSEDSNKFEDIKKVITLLINSGCKVNQTYEKFGNFTPLISAASGGNLPAVEALIESKAEIEKGDKYDFTPLHRAALNGYDKIVKTLLEAGANPNAKTDDKESALKLAKDGLKDSRGGFNEGKDFKKTINLLEKVSKEKTSSKESKKAPPAKKIKEGKTFTAFQKKHKGYTFPPLLKSLFDYWDTYTNFFAGSFEVSIDKYDGIKDWFRNKKADHSKVIVFGQDGIDSLIGFWLYEDKTPLNAPIVYLSGEGEGSVVLANSMEEFLSLLATNRDWEPFDKKFTEPYEEYEEENLKFRIWLKSEFEILPAKNPESVIKKAKSANPDLGKWISGLNL